MRIACSVLAAAVALADFALPALAEEGSVKPAPPSSLAPDAGRYSMTPAEGGFLRLDKETGAVAYCSLKDGVPACRLGADERSALESEVARLRRENVDLKARLAEAPQSRPQAVPSEEEFERALSFTERFLRRIMRIFREEAPPGSPS